MIGFKLHDKKSVSSDFKNTLCSQGGSVVFFVNLIHAQKAKHTEILREHAERAKVYLVENKLK